MIRIGGQMSAGAARRELPFILLILIGVVILTGWVAARAQTAAKQERGTDDAAQMLSSTPPDAGSSPDAGAPQEPSALGLGVRNTLAVHRRLGPWDEGDGERVRQVAIVYPMGHEDNDYWTELEFQKTSGTEQRSVIRKFGGNVWRFGYSRPARAWVFGSAFAVGASMPIADFFYLTDGSSEPRRTRYGYLLQAYAVEASPDSRFIAMIGQLNDGKFRLFVLDTGSDSLFDLGSPPAPAPRDPAFDCNMRYSHGWNWNTVEGVEFVEDSVLRFISPTRLRATYGADGCRKRATKRTAREWDLTALKNPLPVPKGE